MPLKKDLEKKMKYRKTVTIILGIFLAIYLGIVINNLPKGELGYPSNCYVITPYYMSNGIPVGIPNAKLTIDHTVVYSDENGDALFCGMTSQSEDRTVVIEPPSGYSPSKRTETLLGTWVKGTTNFEFTRLIPTTTTTTSVTTTTVDFWQYASCEEAGEISNSNGRSCTAKFMENVAGGTYCYTGCSGTDNTVIYQQIVILIVAILFAIFIAKNH